jgi:uncharacterized protein
MRMIDCDIHVVPTIEDLMPYLEPYWQDYLRDTGFSRSPGMGYTYPEAFPMVATRPEDSTHVAVDDLLGPDGLGILNTYFGLESLLHPFLAPALAKAINRWLLDEWLHPDSQLFGSVTVAPLAVRAAIGEIERFGGSDRFVQLVLPARSEEPYGAERYRPLWKAAVEKELVVALSFGGSTSTPPTAVGWTNSYFETYVLAPQLFQTQLVSMIASGLFTEFPDLRVTLLESGWSWLPSTLWRLDMVWKAGRRETPWIEEPPSAYVRRHVRLASAPADLPERANDVARLLDQLDSSLLLYSSDHPHRYSGQLQTTEFADAEAWYRLI